MSKCWSWTEKSKEKVRGKNNHNYGTHLSLESIEKRSGKNHPNYGKHLSEETRIKISQNAKINPNYGMKGKHPSKATREKLSKSHKGLLNGEKNPMYGKTHSLESRKKMSKATRGKNNHNYGKHWSKKMRERMSGKNHYLYGKHMPQESKEKISKAHKGFHHSLETKEKMSESRREENNGFYGKHHSEKTKRKIGNINSGKNNGFYGKTHTQETINKIKKMRAKLILPMRDTKIEVKTQDLLRQLGFDFFTHQYMKEIEHGYQCDILIPALNLVIECDGDYWHKYPVGNEIDHIRTKELLEKGFKVLRLWGREIRALDLKGFEDIITRIR